MCKMTAEGTASQGNEALWVACAHVECPGKWDERSVPPLL
jgi:hypothetical protein